MRLSLILTALLVLAAMVMPAAADEVDDLVSDLKYGTADVREEAALALGEIGDPRAVDPLIDALKDEYPYVQKAASDALDKMVDVTKCQWDSFTPDQTAFVGPQRGVFPLRKSPFEAGSYLILVGPAGENGLDLPPASWKTFGPYELKSGKKYKATIESPRGESLLFEEDPYDLLSYGDPSPGYASVYARNGCFGDIWYAICLQSLQKSGDGSKDGSNSDDEAELVFLVGDIDNLGFGWPEGFDVFSGSSTPSHPYPWSPDIDDPAGTDRIMVGTSYDGHPPAGQDGYVSRTSREENLPETITMRFDPGATNVTSAIIQMFVDDFQSPVWNGKLQVDINGRRALFLEEVLNSLVQTGPIGKLITVQVPDEFLGDVASGKLNILIDDPTTGAGDGYAVDFVRLLINPKTVKYTGRVFGEVLDEETGEPIKGAVVSASGITKSTTDSDGKYILEEAPAGVVAVTVSKSGYESKTKTTDLISEGDAELDFTLQKGAAVGCSWDSFTPDQTAFVGPQGGVFPLRKSPFEAGSYLVLVGPAGENGLDLPPASWKIFGPYELESGKKYKALIESPRGESLQFEEDPADLSSYSDPSPGYASVYARNDCPGDIWYAICLQLSGAATSPPEEKKVVDLGESLVKLPDESSLIQTDEWGEVPANQVIIVLDEGFGRDYADSIASSKLDGRVVGFIEYINLYQIETSGATQADLIEAISRAENDPNVEIAVPNQQGHLSISPLDDPVYADGRGRGYEILGVKQAWDAILASGLPLAEVQVGVTDDGLYRGWGEFDNAEIDVDENNADLPYPLEGDLYEIAGSHGTGVMNIITADADDGGITGVASFVLGQKLSATMINIFDEPYGTNKEVESTQDPSYPVEYVDGGKTYAIGSLVALKKEIESGSTILSCSWGTADYTKSDSAYATVYKRFFEKISADLPDILFVCAAGNDGVSMDGSRYWPSGLNLANMITVGNLMNDGTKCDSSTMSSDNFEVTLAAPGQQSVWGRDDKGNIVNNYGGTSMATPHVTAAAAMIRSLDPSLNAKEIKKILVDTARTGINLDGKQVAAPPELGGRILAIDLAVEKVIGDLGGASTKEIPPEYSEEEEIFSSNNIQGVYSNPTAPTTFSIDAPLMVTYVMDYHYRNQGVLPGTITLRHADGTTYGPWQASGREGQGGVSNAYWEVRPYAIIKPGTYTILDSNPETWSQNPASGGRGMSEVRGVYLSDSALPTEPSSGIRLLESALSRGISQGAEETIPTDITDRFSTEDASVFSSLKIGPVYGTHTVAWNWYSPDGSLYVDHEEPIIPETEGGDHWAWSSILIKGRDAEDMPGDWRLDVTLDGSTILTEKFYLIEAADAGKVDDLISDLKYGTADVRLEAAYALGKIGDPRAVDPLVEMLNDEDKWIRWNAIHALGNIGDTKAVDPLLKALKDEDPDIRGAASVAIGKIGDTRAIDPLVYMASKDQDEEVRLIAASSLVKLGKTEYYDQVIQGLDADDRYLRELTVELLGLTEDPRAVDPLIDALKDEDVRKEAAWSLGAIGDPRAVAPLIDALKDEDEDEYVRWMVAEALGDIGEPAIDPLIGALKDEDEDVRSMAADTLGYIGDPRAVDPLIDALNDEDEDIRWWAAWSLGEIGDPRAADPLIDALEDEDEYVREAAMEALEKIQSE